MTDEQVIAFCLVQIGFVIGYLLGYWHGRKDGFKQLTEFKDWALKEIRG